MTEHLAAMHLPEPLRPPGEFPVRHDMVRDHIRIEGRGFSTPQDFEIMFETMERIIASYRARGAPVRVFVDNREVLVHGAEAAEALRERARGAYQPGDRIAILAESSLARMQYRRVLDPTTHRLFLTEDAALAWLDERG